jgi:hypothetical protein
VTLAHKKPGTGPGLPPAATNGGLIMMLDRETP